MPDILVVQNLFESFGKLVAVSNLSFEVRQGEILGMMGPNGAGKTTVFNPLPGVLKPIGSPQRSGGHPIIPLSHHLKAIAPKTFVTPGQRPRENNQRRHWVTSMPVMRSQRMS
ncbi:MAG: ATP-binding cassette domain-containing protein [Deltaproteobacteria bacterium]|nr:ATP-binding cassette domain-containing protein [Deltaproteobacteria bacterium]